MADKKFGRASRRPITPTETMEQALSDSGTLNMADIPHDKGKAALVDKFREREERWRDEQSLHDRQESQAEATAAGEMAKEEREDEGGTR